MGMAGRTHFAVTAQNNAAIASYELAVQTLQTIRGDLAIASRDFQFDFRDTVEPVYRELTAAVSGTGNRTQRQHSQQQKERMLRHLT